MEYILDTENISLDYSNEREFNNSPGYRLTLYDIHGHFDKEVYLRKEQILDLIEGLEKLNELK